MLKPLVAFAVAAALVAIGWLRLEKGDAPAGEAAAMVALALLPTLAVARLRDVHGRRKTLLVALALGAAALVALSAATRVPLADARPRDSERDFVGPVFNAIHDGFLEYYDTTLPFNRVDFPLMHGLVLLAIFGFAALTGMLAAARRPIASAAVLLVALGWPATLMPGQRPLAAGALALAGVLSVLFVLRSGTGPTRGLAHAAAAGAVLVALATVASTSEAVAKSGFLKWQTWDLYDRPDDPVDVRYVWDANYDGISFPEKKTVVLRIHVPGPKRSLYWRATTLDEYTGEVWREALEPAGAPETVGEIDVTKADPLLPKAARSDENWVRQEVKVEALRDNHLIGSAQPVRWEPGTSAPVQVASNGSAVVDEGLRQGQRYVAVSYVPQASPKQLRAAGTRYPREARRYLELTPQPDDVPPAPPFGDPGRDAYMRSFVDTAFVHPGHEAVFEVAREVTRGANSPYEAAILLEAWFRGTEGGFTYDEKPPFYGLTPPLVFFLESKRGYCQQFAGAMALMLRMLGVPARVAVGFTSGSYDEGKHEWTVSDHNAHAWVEVYFPRFGWIPFDPTPNRGQLTAAYTPFSPAFDVRDAAGLGPAFLNVPEIREQVNRAAGLEGREPNAGAGNGGVSGTVAKAGRSLLGLLLLVVSIAAAAVIVIKTLQRQLRFLAREPRALAAACRRDLVGYMADQGLAPPPSATVAELGELVERTFTVDSGPFVRAVTEARYGPPGNGRRAVRRARPELRRLRRRMGRELTFAQRARGALSLRSLTV